jgi:hypothetical protein
MTDEEQSKGKGLKSGLSAIGVLTAIVSIWWFALRPRMKSESETDEG